MPKPDTVFSRPSCRVIKCKFDDLESEIRKRTAYDFKQAIRYMDTDVRPPVEMFVVIFQLKAPTPGHPPERIAEDANPPRP